MDKDRKREMRSRFGELGIKQVNCELDAITRERLRELVNASGYGPGKPSSYRGVISEAIRLMYQTYKGKSPKIRLNWRKQHQLIGSNIIKHLRDEEDEAYALEKVTDYEYPPADWYGFEEWNATNLRKIAKGRVPKRGSKSPKYTVESDRPMRFRSPGQKVR